jgi:hypothetical protein
VANKRQAFVEDISRFASGHLASSLIAWRNQVRMLGRKTGNLKHLRELGIKLVKSTLFAPKPLRHTIKDTDLIFCPAVPTQTHNVIVYRYMSGHSPSIAEKSQPLISYSCSKLEEKRICYRISNYLNICRTACACTALGNGGFFSMVQRTWLANRSMLG